MEKCPICHAPAVLAQPYLGGCFTFNCYRCGEFRLSTEADEFLKVEPIKDSFIGAASGYVRANPGLTIHEKDLSLLRRPTIASVQAKATRLLLAFAREHPQPGTGISDPVPRIVETFRALKAFRSQSTYPDDAVPDIVTHLRWLAIASANDASELRWLIKDVLVDHSLMSFTAKQEAVGANAYSKLIITAAGWAEIERMRSTNPESKIGFVAMSFHPTLVPLYDQGIAPGIAAAGYQPIRMDRKEHNERIDDEIIATIKTSRFLVADFTIDRGGIYFEAGYGLGIGIPVIWLVREAEKDAVHFDNRQYNFIRWQPENLQDLRRALKNRIEATIGPGPLPAPG